MNAHLVGGLLTKKTSRRKPMKKNTLLFCNGISGSGKTYFIKNNIPAGLFHNLRSATTRPMRAGESEGNPYFFRDEAYFDTAKLATFLWVNQAIWTPDTPKWIYGVPESEIYGNLGKNFIYDVIEPKYTRQLIGWFTAHKLDKDYEFKVAYFMPPAEHMQTVQKRANMPNDTIVRQINTCNVDDFHKYDLKIDYTLRPIDGIYDKKLTEYIKKIQMQKIR